MSKGPKSQVVLLGTGSPNADPERSGPSVAVVVDGRPYLFDFGPGVVRRASAAQKMGVEGLAVDRLDIAFLTHLHSDHTAGYADLMLTPWVLGREQPLRVFGPPGLETMTRHLLAAYQEDIRERLQELEPANQRGWQVKAQEVEAGPVYKDGRVRVEAFPARHGSWPAFGYRIGTPDRMVVLSGDTAPYAAMLEHYAGCDVLVHEVYSARAFPRLALSWQAYHASMHTSTTELADIARQVRPEVLVLYHQLFWGETEESLVQEVRARYDGLVVSGRDLDVF